MTAADDLPHLVETVLGMARGGPGPIEVAGSGPLAEQLREHTEAAASAGARPGTVVDTTGDLEQLERLVERVEDLGTVILAGPPLPDDATVDLYGDVHVRGLTVIGVPPGGERRG